MKKPERDAEHDTSTVTEPQDAPADASMDADNGNATAEEATDEMAALAAKAQENWERLLRVTAEFDNFRKRAAREKEEAVRYANQKVFERLLPALDSFDMALNAAEAEEGQSSEAFHDGIRLVFQQLRSILKETGLEEIDAQGKPFDPNLHEAVSQIETDEVKDGHVVQQVRKGYILRDRLVRPSSVVVAKKPAG